MIWTTCNRHLAVIVITVLCASALAWLVISPTVPLGRDQGIFAWVGMVILNGGLPYADAWEVKGPVSHVLYAAAIWLFGHSEAAIRIFDGLMLVVALALYAQLGRQFANILAGVASFGMMFVLTRADYWNLAQPDEWAGIILLAATAALLARRTAVDGWFLSGILLGTAALVKPLYVLFCLVHVMAACSCGPRSMRLLGIAALGATLPVVACVLAYSGYGKAGELVNVFLRFNLESHVSRHSTGIVNFAGRVLHVLQAPDVLIAAALAAIGYRHLAARDRFTARLLLVSILVCFAVACAQNKFYQYHFMPFTIFLAALAGFGVAHIAHWQMVGQGCDKRWFVGPMLLGCLLATAAPPAYLTAKFWLRFAVPATVASLELPWQRCDDFCYPNIVEAAEHVRRETKPSESIYLWGFDALIYFLADRPSASRFGFNYPMIVGSPDYKQHAMGEVMEDLSRSKPTLILVQDGDANNLYEKSSRGYLAEFPALQDLLARDYAITFENPSFAIYRKIAD